MKLINNTYRHKEKGFVVRVTTCNKKVATTSETVSGETIKFNRLKFEWMIKKGIFEEVTKQLEN